MVHFHDLTYSCTMISLKLVQFRQFQNKLFGCISNVMFILSFLLSEIDNIWTFWTLTSYQMYCMKFSRCQKPKNFTFFFCKKYEPPTCNVYISPEARDPKTFFSSERPSSTSAKRRTGNCFTLAVGLPWNTGKVVGRSHKNTKQCVTCIIIIIFV